VLPVGCPDLSYSVYEVVRMCLEKNTLEISVLVATYMMKIK